MSIAPKVVVSDMIDPRFLDKIESSLSVNFSITNSSPLES